MPYYNVESLGCFNQVAKVIGFERAVIELSEVLAYIPSKNIFREEDLYGSFYWDDSPQGYKFWSLIAMVSFQLTQNYMYKQEA